MLVKWLASTKLKTPSIGTCGEKSLCIPWWKCNMCSHYEKQRAVLQIQQSDDYVAQLSHSWLWPVGNESECGRHITTALLTTASTTTGTPGHPLSEQTKRTWCVYDRMLARLLNRRKPSSMCKTGSHLCWRSNTRGAMSRSQRISTDGPAHRTGMTRQGQGEAGIRLAGDIQAQVYRMSVS